MLKMLNNKKVQKKIWLALIVLVLPAFFLWGTNSATNQKKQEAVYGKLFGKTIQQQDYLDALKASEVQAMMRFGEDYYTLQKMLNLKGLAIQRLILLHEAAKRKIRISDAELVRELQNTPAFQRNGQFDKKLYENSVKYGLHLQPRVFEEQTRQNLMIQKVYEAVTKDITLTNDEIKKAYKKENEQISLNYIAAIPADFEKDITPSEEEIKGYFDKNSLEFKLPLSFNLEYLETDSKTKMDDVAFRLARKESLEKISQDCALVIKETGLFGQTDPIPGIGWLQEVSEQLPSLKIGQTIPAVELDKRYYLMRLKERKDPYIPEFEAIKEKVKTAVIKTKSKDIAREKAKVCMEKLQAAYQANPKTADFEKISKELQLTINSTDLFKDNSYINTIGASDDFFKAAYDLKTEQPAGPIETNSGIYIIKLKEKIGIDEKKYSEEKAVFSQKAVQQKKDDAFSTFLLELTKIATNQQTL
ncbi:MAG: peptidylprolyl isomerase [Candidatus Omnitrophica bacterium]|nr:peptidylprolyl isomerase [Candidatus Omnitrophota bacterium]